MSLQINITSFTPCVAKIVFIVGAEGYEANGLALRGGGYMKADAERFGGRVLGFTLTPYVSGQPFRISALRGVLADLAADEQVWSATASQIVAAAG